MYVYPCYRSDNGYEYIKLNVMRDCNDLESLLKCVRTNKSNKIIGNIDNNYFAKNI